MNINKKFIEIKSSEGNDQKNVWFEYCREKEIPYITLTTRRRLAAVSWDHISYSMKVQKILINNEEFLSHELKNIYIKYTKENSKFNISCMNATFDAILIEDARRAAMDIYDLINGLIGKYR
jgi:hypothetical protein